MAEALEALYGFTMWIVKASIALALVGALIAVPAYLLSWAWHTLVRHDRRCTDCHGWFGSAPGEDGDPSRCDFCRTHATVSLREQPARSSGG